MFIGHKIEDQNTIILYIDPQLQEFSSELDVQTNGKKRHFNESIKEYLAEKVPNLNPNLVKVVMGTIVVASVSLIGGHAPSAKAAGNDSASVQSETTHTVANGDTLYGIASRYHLSVSQLKQLNGLTSDLIYPGQTLRVSNQASSTSGTTYTVKSGDTLYSLANRFGMSVDQLKQLNGLGSNTLYVGQTLKVTGTSAQSSGGTDQAYVVKSGDTLYTIAQRTNTSVEQLKKLNNLTSNTIYIGQTLQVSGSPQPQVAGATYTVKSGDTLYGIAKAHNMSVSEIKSINNLSSDFLYIGQPLKVTGDAQASPSQQTREQVIQELVKDSYNYIGVPYKWGGTTPAGFDCSGFVSFMFSQHSIDIPRVTSGDYYQMGTAISRSNLQPGDLVFFAVNEPGKISHVGFYVGNNEFISATSSKGIAVVSMDNVYWSKYYVGAKRVY